MMHMTPQAFPGLEHLEQRCLLSASVSGIHPLAVKSRAAATKAPAISVAGDTVVDGDNTQTNTLTFTITRTGPKKQLRNKSVVEYAITGVTAENGSDFTASSGEITFRKGEISKTIEVDVEGDEIYEGPAELIRLKLDKRTLKNARIKGGVAAFGTITENDAAPAMDISDAVAVGEGNTGTTTMTFDVTLSEAAEVPITATYTAAGGTATSGTDFSVATGTLTIPAGETSGTITVNVIGDIVYEPGAAETLTVTLTDPTNATLGDDSATGAITDDDTQPSIAIEDGLATEGDAGTTTMTFTVLLSNPSSEIITVDYTASDGTAEDENGEGDYTSATGTVTFNPGETEKTFTITINGDTTDEDNETFTVTLADPTNATIDDDTANGVIVDNDAAPTLSIDDVTLAEGNAGATTFTFTLALSVPSGKQVSVIVNTANGIATAGSDYTALVDTPIIFNPGDLSKTIDVDIAGDVDTESDETFTVVLSDPANATITDTTGLGTIINDD